MALRDQPYLPLYVQDFLTDEKLIECSASTVGVYIKMMCVMHKSEFYGTILLKQKYKQSDKQNKNFALQIAKSVGFDVACVADAIAELLDEKVLRLDGDFLVQNRMVYDADISEKRAKAGKTGGDKSKKQIPKDKNFAQAKTQANSEIEYEDETVIENDNNLELKEKKSELIDLICEKYGYKEMRFANKQRVVMAYINTFVKSDEDYDYLVENIQCYNLYKQLSEEKQHGFDGLYGTQAEQFLDGALQKENWKQKLNNHKLFEKPKSSFQKTNDVFDQLKILKQQQRNGNTEVQP